MRFLIRKLPLLIKIAFLLTLSSLVGIGGSIVLELGPVVIDHCVSRVQATADRIMNGPAVVVQQMEPEYCDGVCGLLTKHAKAEYVPVAVAKAVAMQEGGHNFTNLQVNCSNRYWAKKHTLDNCALGMMQLIPAFNDIEDPLSILGPENLERNIQLGVRRLRQDFDASKGATTQARWYNAFIKYYGANQDGYPDKVMALVTKFAVEEG